MLLASSNSNFLIPNGTFVAELIMFIVVLGIMAKFILPSLTGVMNERANAIKSAQQASEQGHEQAEQLAVERARILEAARDEARVIMDEVANKNAELFEQARERGRAEHDRLMQAAAPEIDAERTRARDGVLGNFRELVVLAAEQVLEGSFDPSRHDALIDGVVSAGSASKAEGQ